MNNGGAAFPRIEIKQIGDPCYHQPTKVYHSGMSLRDYFAGKALQGLLASMAHPESTGSCLECYPKSAEQAYQIADAMLSAREGANRE